MINKLYDSRYFFIHLTQGQMLPDRFRFPSLETLLSNQMVFAIVGCMLDLQTALVYSIEYQKSFSILSPLLERLITES